MQAAAPSFFNDTALAETGAGGLLAPAMNLLTITSTLVAASVSLQAATTIDPNHPSAYGGNVGWINWQGDATHGAVIGEYVCSGYLYAANVGWINLGNGAPLDGIRYHNLTAEDFGVNHDGAGNLQGYAWGGNVGWLTFTNRAATGAFYDGPRVDLSNGRMSGFIWSANVGWISLSNSVAFVRTGTIRPGADTDGDGITDAWELQNFGNLETANASSDFDSDGVSDLHESIAGTDPRLGDSLLRVTAITVTPEGLSIRLTWPSEPGRQYRILKTSDLGSPTSWSEAGLGLIDPDAGATTTRSVSAAAAPGGFYLIEVVRPLWP